MLCPTDVAISLPPARKPEDAFGDDVALDLRTARVDGFGLGPHPAVLPAAAVDGMGVVRPEGAIHSLDRDGGFLDPLVHLAPIELGQARLRARWHTGLRSRQLAEAVHLERERLDLGLGDALAGPRIGAVPGLADEFVERLHRFLKPVGVREAA